MLSFNRDDTSESEVPEVNQAQSEPSEEKKKADNTLDTFKSWLGNTSKTDALASKRILVYSEEDDVASDANNCNITGDDGTNEKQSEVKPAKKRGRPRKSNVGNLSGTARQLHDTSGTGDDDWVPTTTPRSPNQI